MAIAAQSATWKDEAFSPLNGSLAPAKAKGPFKLGKLIGRTLAVNQLLITPTFPTQTVDGVTFTNNGNGSITVSGTATADITFTIEGNLSRNIPLGNKVLLTNFSNPNHATYYLQDAYEGNMTRALRDTPNGFIKSKEGSSTTISPRIYVMNGVTINETITPKYYDLTLMFGPGREPTTIDEFEQVYSRENTAYTLGQLESALVAAIIARKTDSTEKSRLELPNDLTLNSALDAKDAFEVVGENAVFTKNVGTVDLGTLTWSVNQATNGRFIANYNNNPNIIGSMKVLPDLTTVYNAISPKYVTTYWQNIGSNVNGIAVFGGSGGGIFICDAAYANQTAEAFKTAMDGVILNYELAAPQTITIPLKKLQAVTIGELVWSVDSVGRMSSPSLRNIIKPATSASTIANIYASEWITRTANQTYLRNTGISVEITGSVAIYDSRYTTAADFVAAHRDDVIWFESLNDQAEWNAGTCDAGGEFETGYVSPDAVLKIYERK